MLITILSAVFVFGLLVLFHEFGHFITAKMTGMRVDEFAIGFGPKLISTRKGETVYSIRAVPLGGFNDIAGMDPTDNEAGDRGYCAKPVLSRMIVILAGSFMNFVLPVILFFGIFFFAGIDEPSVETTIGNVIEGKAADVAGLKSGDKILTVNGTKVETWNEFTNSLQNLNEDSNINITFEREGNSFATTLQPEYDQSRNRYLIGVQGTVDHREVDLFESITASFQRTYDIIVLMLKGLAEIFMSPSQAELAGPIGIAQMAGKVAENGLIPLLNFAAIISLNLGIVNLLPVPALDGGHFVTLLLEAVRGKPLTPKAIMYAQRVGIALLLLLMLLATKNDIVRVFFN